VTGASALVSEWQTAKVQRVALTRHGSGFAATVHPWLTGLHNPFALALGPHGSVLVGDWGTGIVYRISPAT
jgi:hypothetical protein